MVDSHLLGADECAALLRADVVGRIAVCTPTGPHVIPVNYCVIDDAIILRTTAHSVLGRHGRDTVLSFQIDALDHSRHRGWSVQARGRSEEVTDADELAHIREVQEPLPWASGGRSMYLRLRWDELTGRQLGRRWGPLEESRTQPSR